jgi:hypothetical protein
VEEGWRRLIFKILKFYQEEVKKMKWLAACLLVLCMVVPAMAGEDPFIAVVGNDIDANRFYVSPKHELYLYDQLITGLPTANEGFATDHPLPVFPEICDYNGEIVGAGVWNYQGVPSRLVGLQNAGWFTWSIRIPKKPNALNICFECGVLKPNTFQVFGFDAVLLCAANTGEKQFPGGVCARDDVNPGQNPVIANAQPMITAVASPGPNNSFAPFHLTAYRNPGTYNNVAQPMTNNQALQVLDGSSSARVMLKSCLDKCINIKIPVTGQINAMHETEEDLEFGDIITILMEIPRTNTVDIYCGAESARLTGIGETLFPLVP